MKKGIIVVATCSAMLGALSLLLSLTRVNENPNSGYVTKKLPGLPLTNERPDYSNIMVGVRLTDKMGHTEFTASIIRKFQKIEGRDVYVFTRNGFGYSDGRLSDWYGKRIKAITQPSRHSEVNNILRTFTRTKYKILFLIDSNIVFLPSWGDFITKHMIKGKLSFLSLHHSAYMHNFTSDCQEYVGDLCKGPLHAKAGVAISQRLAESILLQHSESLENYHWDNILKAENLPSLYPRYSLVMHIDQTNRDEHLCGDNDVPYEFKLCDLPYWIRDGIEFYFDRCTNPQHIFSPEFSTDGANIERRMWTRPVVAYSLYGNKTRYTKGAIVNAKRLFSIYPGWKIWVYLDDSVTDDMLHKLCSKSVRFIDMTGTAITNQMSWRFLVAGEPTKMFTILDIDYKILTRGKAATDDWIKSGRKFHVMRDHPNHSRYEMSGGMWGGIGNSIPNIKELILQYDGNNGYLVDMNFLNGVLWPMVKKSVWAHDAYSLHKFGEDHPFPTNRSKNNAFVGSVDFS